MPWTFWVIVLITLLFVAVLLTRVIMTPIKRRREDARWNRIKTQWS